MVRANKRTMIEMVMEHSNTILNEEMTVPLKLPRSPVALYCAMYLVALVCNPNVAKIVEISRTDLANEKIPYSAAPMLLVMTIPERKTMG
jgi:hypothetical protein